MRKTVQVFVLFWGCHLGLGNVCLRAEWVGCVRLPGKLFSPIDGMKNFITLSKLLDISSAHHSVIGFMLPKHLLHCICYFSNGAPKIQTQSINMNRRLVWKQKSLAVAQLSALLQDKFSYTHFPFGATTLNIWFTPASSAKRTCKSIFSENTVLLMSELILQVTRQQGPLHRKMFQEIKSNILNWEFSGAQTARSCIWTRNKIQNTNQEEKKKSNNWSLNFLTGICLPFPRCLYFSIFYSSSLLLALLLYALRCRKIWEFHLHASYKLCLLLETLCTLEILHILLL